MNEAEASSRQRSRSPLEQKLHRGLQQFLLFWKLLVRNIRRDRCAQQANALAYTTILSLVPVVAISFTAFKAFGTLSDIQARAREFLLNNLVSDASEDAIQYIDQFTQNVNTGALGLIGTVALALISISLFLTIERSFNTIWRVPRPRSLVARITAFWFVISFGPLLLGLSIFLTAKVQSLRLVQELTSIGPIRIWSLHLLPWVVTCLTFALGYWLIPNTRVHRRAAILGGLLGGTLWEVAKVGFDLYMSRVLTYRRIYGSLGAIPIFLVWIYVTWFVVLLGSEAAFVLQNFQRLRRETGQGECPLIRERLALGILVLIGRAFAAGQPPPDRDRLVSGLSAGQAEVEQLLREFHRSGWIRSVEEGGWLPSRPLEEISLARVLSELGQRSRVFQSDTELDERLIEVLETFYRSPSQGGSEVTLGDLVAD